MDIYSQSSGDRTIQRVGTGGLKKTVRPLLVLGHSPGPTESSSGNNDGALGDCLQGYKNN